DDIPLLGHGDAVLALEIIVDRADDEGAGATGLDLDVGDLRGSTHLLADMQRLQIFRAGAAEHPPRQRHRRHEATALRVAVRPDLRRRHARLEEAPMRHRRDRVAFLRHGRLVEQGIEAMNRRDGRPLLYRLGTADPVTQMVEVLGSLGTHAANSFRIASPCWSSSGTGPYSTDSPAK